MKVIIAPDSFKESLSALDVCNSIREGLLEKDPHLEVTIAPIADGGEGTVETLMTIPGSQLHESLVTGPLLEKIEAKWGIVRKEGEMAIIEMSASSGLPLIPSEKRDPMLATTFGVGELLQHALDKGITNILIGIGGSATNDGGAGMLQALRYELNDASGNPIPTGNQGLRLLASIDDSHVDPAIQSTQIIVASDVQNPLTGANGASYVYGPQKGGTEDTVPIMDENMAHFADVVASWKGSDLRDHPGAGAAGGLGFALIAFLNAELRSGFESIAEMTQLEEKIKKADWVITGEGKLDSQTLQGKGPFGVSQLAKKHNKPVIAVGGIIDPTAKPELEKYFDTTFQISPPGTSKTDSIQHAAIYLKETGRKIAGYITKASS